MSKKQKSLPLRGPKLKTNPAVTMRIYRRADSPFFQVSLRGQAISFVRRSTKRREPGSAAQFGELLMRHLQRKAAQPARTPEPQQQEDLL